MTGIPGDLANWLDSNKDFDPTTSDRIPNWTDQPPADDYTDPDWTKSYTNLKEVELIKVSQDDPVCDYLMKEVHREDPTFWWDNPKAVDRLTELLNEHYRKQRTQWQDANEALKQDYLRQKIDAIKRKLVREALDRVGRPWTDYQAVIKALSRYLAKRVSGDYTKEATSTQLQATWDYLIGTEKDLHQGIIPPWAKQV